MRTDLPSGTVTFLFTDVERSTRLLHSLGAESSADALAEHRATKALGQERLEELLSEGASLTWEQAVEYALASID